jgi:hypothetical protein
MTARIISISARIISISAELLGRGEDHMTAAAETAERRVSPTIPGCQKTGPYPVALTTHHELSFSGSLKE